MADGGSGDGNGENRICPFPYGSAEHLAWSLRESFGVECAGFALWQISEDEDEKNIAFFLNAMYEKYGMAEAQYCAHYLYSFEYLPPISTETKHQMILNQIEREMRESDGDFEQLSDD